MACDDCLYLTFLRLVVLDRSKELCHVILRHYFCCTRLLPNQGSLQIRLFFQGRRHETHDNEPKRHKVAVTEKVKTDSEYLANFSRRAVRNVVS